VPDKVPAEQFWAVTLYDHETCSFICDVNRVGLDSYDQKMHCNNDRSVYIYFGPKQPTGQVANWIPPCPAEAISRGSRFSKGEDHAALRLIHAGGVRCRGYSSVRTMSGSSSGQ
jgi:hypothetical protein